MVPVRAGIQNGTRGVQPVHGRGCRAIESPAKIGTTLEQPVPDSTLARQAADGRQRAFRELLNRYEKPVFSLVYRMVRDRALAEDLAQEAFIRAFNAIASYNPRYKFSSWIFKIAHNLTIDHLRRKRLNTISIDGSPHALTEEEQARTRPILESDLERPDAYVENMELGSRSKRHRGSCGPVPVRHAPQTCGRLLLSGDREIMDVRWNREDVHHSGPSGTQGSAGHLLDDTGGDAD